MSESESLLRLEPVRALLSSGAATGQVSYTLINDLLIDLELEEEDVEALFALLETRAISVVDQAPARRAAPSPAPPRAPRPASTRSQATASDGDDEHSDLDAILADLDATDRGADVESVAAFLSEIEAESGADEGDNYAGEDLDDAQAPVTDALRLYLNRMGQVPRLEPETERELARVMREADSDSAREARNALVEANLRLVVHLARAAAPRTTLSITDLLQEGNIGLLDAVERYRPESTKTFGAYATWWIRRAMNRAINDNSRMLRLSGELYAAIQKMQAAQRELTQQLGRTPSRAEIAEKSGLTTAQIEEAQRAASRPLSLDQPLGGGEEASEFGDQLFDPEAEIIGEAAQRQEARAGLEALVADLSPREAAVVTMRYGLGEHAEIGPRSSEDVAAALNLSRERVHELEVRALRRLRRRARGAGLDELF